MFNNVVRFISYEQRVDACCKQIFQCTLLSKSEYLLYSILFLVETTPVTPNCLVAWTQSHFMYFVYLFYLEQVNKLLYSSLITN